MTDMSELTEFLLARIAEDEVVARAVTSWPGSIDPAQPGDVPSFHAHAKRWVPPRVLAECEAKRRIVAWCVAVTDRRSYGDWEYTDAPDLADDTLRALALPYADHPDYRAEWAV